MKKKFAAILMAGAFLIGGTVTYAASNYYADLLSGQQEQMSKEVKRNYEKLSQEIGEVQHHDMVSFVEDRRQEILDEVNEYAKVKISNDATARREEHTRAVNQEVERMVKELKEFVDTLE